MLTYHLLPLPFCDIIFFIILDPFLESFGLSYFYLYFYSIKFIDFFIINHKHVKNSLFI